MECVVADSEVRVSGAAVRVCTLMLLRLTSVREGSLLFILCRVSSTLVGLGGSSNTGTIFSPLMTSRRTHAHRAVVMAP